MPPPRGLSRSEIRNREIDTAIGMIKNTSQSVLRARNPIRKLQPTDVTTISTHASHVTFSTENSHTTG